MTTGIVIALAELSAAVPRSRPRRDRRGGDRDHAFRQRGGAAAGAGAGRGGAHRAAGRRVAAAVLRLARRTSPTLVRGEVLMLEGGHDYDGRPIVPFDEDGMRRPRGRSATAASARSRSPRSFRRSTRAHEERRPKSCAEECPEAAITLSHDLGRIGLLERENAALLNAALIPLARTTIAGFTAADRGERDRRTALPDPERRHGDDGSGRGGAAGHELRLGRHQLDARCGLSVRPGRRRSWSMSAAPRPMSGSCAAAFRARRTRWSRWAGCAPSSACRICCSIGLGGGSLVARDPLSGRAAQPRLSADPRGAGVRRQHR